MDKLFISHSSQDDGFVRERRAALADHGQEGWIDSRELRGGDPLWSEIKKAIDAASAYTVVFSTDALQSKWVGKELRHALKVRKKRVKDRFPVIPLSLNGTKLGVLEEFFGEEPIYIPVSSDAGGVEAAMNEILVALGKRLPADVAPTPQPKAEPLEETGPRTQRPGVSRERWRLPRFGPARFRRRLGSGGGSFHAGLRVDHDWRLGKSFAAIGQGLPALRGLRNGAAQQRRGTVCRNRQYGERRPREE
jgi:hypothetical protein